MKKLTVLLNNIDGSYYDFVVGILQYAEESPSHIEAITRYITENHGCSTSDVVRFVSLQNDFFENKEEYSKVG